METADQSDARLPRPTVALLVVMAVFLIAVAIAVSTWALSRPEGELKCEDVKAVLPADKEAEYGPLTMNADCQLIDRNGYVRVDKTFRKP